jgi:hypothetical protein
MWKQLFTLDSERHEQAAPGCEQTGLLEESLSVLVEIARPYAMQHPAQKRELQRMQGDAGLAELEEFGQALKLSGTALAVGSTIAAEVFNKPEFYSGTIGGVMLAFAGAGIKWIGKY